MTDHPSGTPREERQVPSSLLVAILATPPSATSGVRTRARLALAADAIGATALEVVNLLDVATRDVLDMADAGREVEPWLASRDQIHSSLAKADQVLLAWGISEPTGPARSHHRAQVHWVMEDITANGLSWWTVGGSPRHPSRWQRYTARTYPGRAFREALDASLRQMP